MRNDHGKGKAFPLGTDAPADYGRSPIIAATKHPKGREDVKAEKSQRVYFIGGVDPRIPGVCYPAFDVRHGRAILALLCFRPSFSKERFINFSLNAICKTYASHQGGRYSREILSILKELTQIPVRVHELVVNNWFSYKILDSLTIIERPIRRRDDSRINDPQTELWLNGCTISSEFLHVLETDDLIYFRLDQLKKIRHPLGQAMYFYLPSRAYHTGEEKPWAISASELCKQVGYPLPNLLSRRRMLFEGDRRISPADTASGREPEPSLLRQLDGLETAYGIFRIRGTFRKDDYYLEMWSETRPQPPKQVSDRMGKLAVTYLTGHTEEDLERRLLKIKPLEGYQIAKLQEGKVDLTRTLDFFEQANCLLGTVEFTALIHNHNDLVRRNVLINGEPIKNHTGFFIDACIRAVRDASARNVARHVINVPSAQVPSPTNVISKIDPPKRLNLNNTTPNDDTQQGQLSEEKKQSVARGFWADQDPKNRPTLEEEALKDINEFDRQILERGTELSKTHRESLLNRWALQRLGLLT